MLRYSLSCSAFVPGPGIILRTGRIPVLGSRYEYSLYIHTLQALRIFLELHQAVVLIVRTAHLPGTYLSIHRNNKQQRAVRSRISSIINCYHLFFGPCHSSCNKYCCDCPFPYRITIVFQVESRQVGIINNTKLFYEYMLYIVDTSTYIPTWYILLLLCVS